jgi:hypothetical protein
MVADNMYNVYAVAVDGVLPRLRSFRVELSRYKIRSDTQSLPPLASLGLPKLESFDFIVKLEGGEVEWTVIEALTSLMVMPRLRCCTLDYDMTMGTDLLNIFRSPLFDNDERHVRVRFVLNYCTLASDFPTYLLDKSIAHSGRYNEICRGYVSFPSFCV